MNRCRPKQALLKLYIWIFCTTFLCIHTPHYITITTVFHDKENKDQSSRVPKDNTIPTLPKARMRGWNTEKQQGFVKTTPFIFFQNLQNMLEERANRIVKPPPWTLVSALMAFCSSYGFLHPGQRPSPSQIVLWQKRQSLNPQGHGRKLESVKSKSS